MDVHVPVSGIFPMKLFPYSFSIWIRNTRKQNYLEFIFLFQNFKSKNRINTRETEEKDYGA